MSEMADHERERPVELKDVPDEEGVSQADAAERLDEDPEDQRNRQDPVLDEDSED
jgi:hypothetical protein